MQSCKSQLENFHMVSTLHVKPNSNAMVSSVGLKIVRAFNLIRIHLCSDFLSLKLQRMSLTEVRYTAFPLRPNLDSACDQYSN